MDTLRILVVISLLFLLLAFVSSFRGQYEKTTRLFLILATLFPVAVISKVLILSQSSIVILGQSLVLIGGALIYLILLVRQSNRIYWFEIISPKVLLLISLLFIRYPRGLFPSGLAMEYFYLHILFAIITLSLVNYLFIQHLQKEKVAILITVVLCISWILNIGFVSLWSFNIFGRYFFWDTYGMNLVIVLFLIFVYAYINAFKDKDKNNCIVRVVLGFTLFVLILPLPYIIHNVLGIATGLN